MRLLVMLENGRRREVFAVETLGGPYALHSVNPRLQSWLCAAVEHSRTSGMCRAFTVSIHQLGAECDHEMPGDVVPR